MGGIVFGVVAFGGAYDVIQPLYLWGQMGVRTLPEVLGIQAGLIATAVVLMAVTAFAATEYFGNHSSHTPCAIQFNLTYQKAGVFALSVLAFGLLTGCGMASHAKANVLVAAAPVPGPAAKAIPAAHSAGGAQAAAPAPLPGLPGGARKFKKGSSCS